MTYTYVSGEPGGTANSYGGLGWPPLLGMVLGVVAAGAAGVLFSPIAARLRGIYLGIASLGLVFIGEHVLNTWTSVTGGFNGRLVPAFSLFGFSFGGERLAVPRGPRRAVRAGRAAAGTSAWRCASPPAGSPRT